MRSRRLTVAIAIALIAALVIPLLITVAVVAAQTTGPDDPTGEVTNGATNGDATVDLDDATAEASFVDDGVRITRGIVTGVVDGTPLTLDVYQPEAAGAGRPGIVLIHGGAWFQGAPIDMEEQGRLLATQGWVGFSVSYRLAAPGRPTWPAALSDVQRQIRWVGANAETYGVDPAKIAVLGSSAGGHLAALVASLGTADLGALSGEVTDDPNPPVTVAAVAAWSPPLELADLAGIDGQPPAPCGTNELCATFWQVPFVETFLGCPQSACPATYVQASPVNWVKPETTPLWLANGTDEIVPIGQLQAMAAQLAANRVEHSVEIVPGEDHANAYSSIVWNEMSPWLAQRLGVEAPNPIQFPATGSVLSNELVMALIALTALGVVVSASVWFVGRDGRVTTSPADA